MVKIEFVNGDKINGEIIHETDNIIKVWIIENETITFNKRFIKNMVRGI